MLDWKDELIAAQAETIAMEYFAKDRARKEREAQDIAIALNGMNPAEMEPGHKLMILAACVGFRRRAMKAYGA